MKSMTARFVCAVLLLLLAVVPEAHALWLELPNSGEKCVSEELHSNVVVLADYYCFIGEEYDVNDTATPYVSVKVMSPYGKDLYHQEKVNHGKFGFTTTDSGIYTACFSVDADSSGGKVVHVGIDWKNGIAAKDWDSVARKEKLEGLELELKKLEENVNQIQENLVRLMTRELEMWGVTETANARVARYSIMSLGVCIVVSVIQLWYLRRYFQKKKLI